MDGIDKTLHARSPSGTVDHPILLFSNQFYGLAMEETIAKLRRQLEEQQNLREEAERRLELETLFRLLGPEPAQQLRRGRPHKREHVQEHLCHRAAGLSQQGGHIAPNA